MYENGTSTKVFPEVDNVLAPRLAFEMMSWRPPLKDAKCPLLVVAGRNDDMIPMHVTQKVAEDAGESEYHTSRIAHTMLRITLEVRLEWYPGGHFDVLEGGSVRYSELSPYHRDTDSSSDRLTSSTCKRSYSFYAVSCRISVSWMRGMYLIIGSLRKLCFRM